MFEQDNYSPNFALDCAKLSKGICEGLNEECCAIATNVIANKCSLIVAKSKNHSYSDRIQALNEVRFTWRDIVKTSFKVIAHKAFRLMWHIKKRKLRNNSPDKVFKAWVEVNIDSWGGEYTVRDSCILVLPFPLRLSRQLDFIKGIERGCDYSLYGYAYSLRKLLQHIIYRDIKTYALLEYSASTSYVRDIRALGVTETYHMDDVEVQSYVANCKLMKEGVLVHFRNHGVGRYSPYFSASSAVFFNESQRTYYESLNTFKYTGLMYSQNRTLKFERSSVQHIVFVSQLIDGLPGEYELLEKRVLEKLSILSNELGFSLSVKLHPNGRNVDFLKRYSEVVTLTPSNDCSTIFFTNYSTSYYTFEQYGPTYLIRSMEVDPGIFFGDGERIVDEAAFDDSTSFYKAISYKDILFNNLSEEFS